MLLLPYSQPSKVLLGTVGANRRGVVNVEWDLDANKTLAEGVTNSDFINRMLPDEDLVVIYAGNKLHVTGVISRRMSTTAPAPSFHLSSLTRSAGRCGIVNVLYTRDVIYLD